MDIHQKLRYRALFCLLLLAGSLPVAAQDSVKVAGISMAFTPITQHKPTEQPEDVLHMEVPYGKPFFINVPEGAGTEIRDNGVHRIDLIYTDFPRDTADWGQSYMALMEGRVRSLFEQLPSLRTNAPKIRWRLVEQRGCTTEEEAEGYFHGFAVYLGEPKSETDTATDAPNAFNWPNDTTEVTYLPPGFENLPSSSLKEKQVSSFQEVFSIVENGAEMEDSIVFNVLQQHQDWKDMLVVVDWTGSMYPYGAQVLRWIKTQQDSGNIRHLVLFNDGDDWVRSNPFAPKAIGHAGGVYYPPLQPMDSLYAVMLRAMLRGDGGLPAENDMEALMKASRQKAGDFTEVVLIADNTSRVRDLELVEDYEYPVRIILCGIKQGKSRPNGDYLYLAWKTGGGLYTLEEALEYSKEDPTAQEQMQEFLGYLIRMREDGRFIIQKKEARE